VHLGIQWIKDDLYNNGDFMSAWPGKYVIGLTGNIATGKSIVRKMLEHLGACGIDADALSNQALAKGSRGYQPVVDIFGRWILTSEEEIDRAKLGRLVFSEPEALQKLEQIVHPLVLEAVDSLVSRSNQLVFVIEAIKLLESGLAVNCDTIWVTSSPLELQLERLMKKRGMSEPQALQRINAQTAQNEKIAHADVLIKNHRSLQDTWDQVVTAWRRISQHTPVGVVSVECDPKTTGEAVFQRTRPEDTDTIAELLSRLGSSRSELMSDDSVDASAKKA
jgi:dephospho-CoA kinase